MTRRIRLTDAGIMRLKPGKTDYTIRDTVTPGLGVRVRTSGFRGYVFHQGGAGQPRRISLGPVTLKSVRCRWLRKSAQFWRFAALWRDCILSLLSRSYCLFGRLLRCLSLWRAAKRGWKIVWLG